jgi:hypothetical protein
MSILWAHDDKTNLSDLEFRTHEEVQINLPQLTHITLHVRGHAYTREQWLYCTLDPLSWGFTSLRKDTSCLPNNLTVANT